MKKFIIIILSVTSLLLLLAGGMLGIYLVHKNMPSTEYAKENEWFGVDGDEIAVIFRDLLQEETGISADGQIYLPLEWINENINDRFYWDSGGQQIIYALPESIVYADLEMTGSNNAKLIKMVGDRVYLLSGIVAAYTNIQLEPFTDAEAKRLFLDDRWTDLQIAALKKDVPLRTTGSIKSKILTAMEKGEKVVILDRQKDWSLVRTSNGFVGYLQSKWLGEAVTESQINIFDAPVYKNISLNEEICMVWHQVTVAEANDKLEQLLDNTQGINVISPTWFMLTDNRGNFDSLASKAYVDTAHERGIQVWAATDNFNRGGQVRSELLFADTNARRRLVHGLVEEVKKYGIDGINLDIEGIKPEAGPHYIQFIRELSIECRSEGIVLSVDNYVPSVGTAFYNRAEQGIVVDYIIIMAYDEHPAGGVPGTVSSLAYVRSGIENTLKEVPREKVICGLPFYTRLWREEEGNVTSQALGISGSGSWLKENNVNLYWQEELGQYYGELTEGNVRYTIWAEEGNSLSCKLTEVRGHSLAGAAYWKLGLESPEIWELVKP